MGTDVPEIGQVTPSAFQRDHEGVGGERVSKALVDILDLQEQQPAVTRLRDWAMAVARPLPGQTVVDVGAGTGTETQRLAVAVGAQGRAVGVEPHPRLREEALRRAAEVGSLAEFVPGDAMALPMPDQSVDVLRSERVFQHLADPQAAADEVARVLRPGGIAVLLDTDWATMVAYPADPALLRRYAEAFQGTVANPFAGRQLRSWLARAGLEVDEDVGSAALVVTADQIRGPGFLRDGAEYAVSSGSLRTSEAEAFIDGLAAAAERGEAFAAVTMFAVVGRKPPPVSG
jgi:ubiquinone/menaquinone biosynthesis C-methylase UbiE